MRKFASFDVPNPAYRRHEHEVPADELAQGAVNDATGRVYTAKAPPPSTNIVPMPVPPPDADGKRAAGVMVDGVARRGFPTPSGKLEFYSSTLAAWGWKEYAIPTTVESHVSPRAIDASKGEFALIPTFRLPMLIHTRSGNAKWLNEIAHSNPLWLATADAARLGVEIGDLLRVETDIGFFVLKAWVTEGMKPGAWRRAETRKSRGSENLANVTHWRFLPLQGAVN